MRYAASRGDSPLGCCPLGPPCPARARGLGVRLAL